MGACHAHHQALVLEHLHHFLRVQPLAIQPQNRKKLTQAWMLLFAWSSCTLLDPEMQILIASIQKCCSWFSEFPLCLYTSQFFFWASTFWLFRFPSHSNHNFCCSSSKSWSLRTATHRVCPRVLPLQSHPLSKPHRRWGKKVWLMVDTYW